MRTFFLSLSLLCPWLLLSAPVAAVEWVDVSDRHAQVLLEAQARFSPEFASAIGLAEHDARIADLGEDIGPRRRAALAEARRTLEGRLLDERQPQVRQDLQLMIAAANRQIEGSELNERHLLPYVDVPRLVFAGVQGLLQEQIAAERRAAALPRLQAYVGLADPDTPSAFAQARARFEEKLGERGLLGPVVSEVEQGLANIPTYAAGIRSLFERYEIDGEEAEAALAALDAAFAAHAEWVRAAVLPRARSEARLPDELYAYQLRSAGIEIAPEALIEQARVAFVEIREQMQRLAPQVAEAHDIASRDYREVIRALKREQLDAEEIEGYYREVIDEIDRIIARERIVDLPERPMVMRLGTPAESAAQPAPHFRPAPLIGNTGEQGQFVLPLGNPGAEAGPEDRYDDFTFRAAAWTLSAHEGRPGHELQFTAMVERGVSLARSLFARNSVNVEGWALYAEAEMVPHEPPEGQLIALQFRLLRAARAILDPMLNLGLISRAEAERILLEDVVLSPAMARQELDRYQFRAPGQAGSYFHGYQRILALRAEAEIALGERFDRLAYNNFLLDQGMLPPDLLAEAVRREFIPARKGR